MEAKKILRLYYLRLADNWDNLTEQQKIQAVRRPLRWEFSKCIKFDAISKIRYTSKSVVSFPKNAKHKILFLADSFGWEPREHLEHLAKLTFHLLNQN